MDQSQPLIWINARFILSQKCGGIIVIFAKSGWVEGHISEKKF